MEQLAPAPIEKKPMVTYYELNAIKNDLMVTKETFNERQSAVVNQIQQLEDALMFPEVWQLGHKMDVVWEHLKFGAAISE